MSYSKGPAEPTSLQIDLGLGMHEGCCFPTKPRKRTRRKTIMYPYWFHATDVRKLFSYTRVVDTLA